MSPTGARSKPRTTCGTRCSACARRGTRRTARACGAPSSWAASPSRFFRANDLPFGRHIGMPYRDFMLNIQPDDFHQLNKRVAHLLASPGRLRRMQEVPARACHP